MICTHILNHPLAKPYRNTAPQHRLLLESVFHTSSLLDGLPSSMQTSRLDLLATLRRTIDLRSSRSSVCLTLISRFIKEILSVFKTLLQQRLSLFPRANGTIAVYLWGCSRTRQYLKVRSLNLSYIRNIWFLVMLEIAYRKPILSLLWLPVSLTLLNSLLWIGSPRLSAQISQMCYLLSTARLTD